MTEQHSSFVKTYVKEVYMVLIEPRTGMKRAFLKLIRNLSGPQGDFVSKSAEKYELYLLVDNLTDQKYLWSWTLWLLGR